MKKLWLFFALLMLGTFSYAGGWIYVYDDALVQAKKLHKPIIMMYSAKD